MEEKMKKIILGLMLFVATMMFASDKVYEAGEYEVKDGIFYEIATNTKLNGIVKSYYESGELNHEWNCKDGKKNGIGKWYQKTGALGGEANYKDGKANGIGKTYYESGALKSEENYKNGKQDGIYKTYYESGILETQLITRNGKAISGMFYKKNGKKERNMTNADFTRWGLGY
jgi:antitoxin component YwqK of YwqJK toxin-antitoxin module